MRVIALIQRIASDRFVQFLAVGAALYLGHAVLTGSPLRGPRDARLIEIDAGRLELLDAEFVREHFRRPSHAELAERVDQYIDTEVLVREARALGFDEDLVVRRRLAQKMRFLLEDTVRVQAPKAEEIEAFLATRDPPHDPDRLDLEQVFFSERDGVQAAWDRARAAAAALASETRPDLEVGDPFVVARALEGQTRDRLARDFGAPFAAAAFALIPGRWQAVRSDYGAHAVRVTRRAPTQAWAREQAVESASQQILAARRAKANRRRLAVLRAQYRTEIADPDLTAALAALRETLER